MVGGQHLQVLNALDVAKTQWYDFTAIIIAGMGFFTNAYYFFCISLVTKLLGRTYYFEGDPKRLAGLPPNVFVAVNGVTCCSTLAGLLFFGWLKDKTKRKKVYGMTLMVMVICSIASGLSFFKDSEGDITTLWFLHFWFGFRHRQETLLSVHQLSKGFPGGCSIELDKEFF